ncbi:MAG: hypothetical protein ACOYBR_00895 [Fluviibacter sp.]|jgi:hypothetical protein
MTEFGQRLYLTNIPAEIAEDEIRALIFKYTHEEPTSFERVDQDSAHPVYVLSFTHLVDGKLQQIAQRLNEMYWHEQHIYAHVI